MAAKNNRPALIILALALGTFAAFWQVTQNSFINYDDQDYVTDNPMVRSGLNAKSIAWAFTADHAGNWHPVTWLSHMLDVQLFGLNPGWHHLTNLLFHILNTLLLFLVLNQMTAARWRSAFVAALFALHPLHVESVAWIAERKDVLSTCFFLLTLWAYAGFVQAKLRTSRFDSGTYLLALLFFGLGLMSKPMLVTTPFVLLLLDFWPLGRFQTQASPLKVARRLLPEKIPFFGMAVISCAITFIVQNRGGAMSEVATLPIETRISNSLLAYVSYIRKLFWPVDLAVFYPYPRVLPIALVACAGLLVAGITTFALFRPRRSPHFLVGWLWFLGTLVPVIGLVQVGTQAMADRYTYIPFIGLFIVITWSALEIVGNKIQNQFFFAALAFGILAACVGLTISQVGYWQNSATLFAHALQVTHDNAVAQYSFGVALVEQKRLDDAFPHFLEAVRIKPDYAEAHNNIGLTLVLRGNFDEAIEHYRTALQARPDSPEFHFNLGRAFAFKGKPNDAIPEYETALKLSPEMRDARNSLGIILGEQGKFDEAWAQFREVLRLEPNDADTHYNFGNTLLLEGKLAEAAAHFAEAAKLKPDDPDAHQKLALILVRQNKPADAEQHFAEVAKLRPDDAQAYYNFALALAMNGKNREAIQEYRRALTIQPDLATALNALAWILATSPDEALRNGAEAVRLAKHACEISEETRFLGTLDAALAAAGQFDDAIQMAEKVHQLALSRGETELAQATEDRLKLYHLRKAFRQKK